MASVCFPRGARGWAWGDATVGRSLFPSQVIPTHLDTCPMGGLGCHPCPQVLSKHKFMKAPCVAMDPGTPWLGYSGSRWAPSPVNKAI